MKTWFGFLLLAALVVAVGFFVSRNGAPVSIDLGFGTVIEAQLWTALLAATLLGVSVTAAFLGWPLLSLRLRVRRSGKRITELEQEVHGLRTLPLEDQPPRPSQVGER